MVRENFTEAKHEAQREVARFSDERARLYGQVGMGWIVRSSATIIRTVAHLSIPSQISSAQEEYDCLKVVQSQQIRDHQQRIKDATKVPPL